MVSAESPQSCNNSAMAKYSSRNKSSGCFSDGCLFLGGAFSALVLVWGFWSFISTIPPSNSNFDSVTSKLKSLKFPGAVAGNTNCAPATHGADLHDDPPEKTFYDDPDMGYTMAQPMKNWDEKRKEWLSRHPSFIPGAQERVLLVTGSQPSPCRNSIGDHLLLRLFKNKVDYCRLHGYDIFYNAALLHPRMKSYWAKYPVVKAAMLAHPEAEWIWWVDSDALFTDMDFKLPLHRYKDHNLIVHGWAHLIHEQKSWTGLNAGVFLIRNCQWSLDLMEAWTSMGPQTPEYEKWGKILRATFKDKEFPESDDQTGLAFLISEEKEKWADKIYLEGEYYFEGYWEEIVKTYENITERYSELEREDERLRRRHAEKVSESYGAVREPYLKEAGNGRGSWRRPFITHFTGCQPCSGNYNHRYTADMCWSKMVKALNFADNQVMRNYGYVHPDLLDNSVSPVPFDYPA
ncbi:galactomannan galactosyltransferase 1-like [Prosopis cineraria]|uniref:galactomannan galactosyltransferase 1-like n=1 Tax=Prosopis cineraria TaxID=364024 RepID=UPI00240EB0DD|nr:galactomannan galactosyltransferase 1-like [Prosopis cineraria]